MRHVRKILGFTALMTSTGAIGNQQRDLRIPNEYEQTGSSAQGVLNAGVTEADGTAAAGTNPALLALNREYSMGIAYHWPDAGRNFYRVNVVDGVTSTYAAAVTYTGFQDDADALATRFSRDSLVTKRASLSVAYPFKHFALGVSGFYHEGVKPKIEHQEVIKGVSLGLGGVALLTRQVKIGASVQNLNNASIESIAPLFYRAGISWEVVPEWTIYGDLRVRERVASIEGEIQPIAGLDLDAADLAGFESNEQMAYFGNKIKIYNLVRMDFVYGVSLDDNDSRQSMAGGIGIAQQNYSLTYSVSKPYMEYDDLHAALSLQIFMKM